MQNTKEFIHNNNLKLLNEDPTEEELFHCPRGRTKIIKTVKNTFEKENTDKCMNHNPTTPKMNRLM